MARLAQVAVPMLVALTTIPAPSLGAQQVPDTLFEAKVGAPAYRPGAGPRIGIDEAHHNFHTAVGRYRPFARLAERDGYRIVRVGRALTSEQLAGIDVLVIANPLNALNDNDNWTLPTPSAYTPDEVKAVRQRLFATVRWHQHLYASAR